MDTSLIRIRIKRDTRALNRSDATLLICPVTVTNATLWPSQEVIWIRWSW